jgi:hypothetical protein
MEVARPRCLEMLKESYSTGVCILEIINHPHARMNTGSKGFFCFREYSLLSREEKICPRKMKKNSGTFFYTEGSSQQKKKHPEGC